MVFRRDFAALPDAVKQQAREAYGLFAANPSHPSLKFKKLPLHDDLWSGRVSNNYRAIGRWRGDVILCSLLARTRTATSCWIGCNRGDFGGRDHTALARVRV